MIKDRIRIALVVAAGLNVVVVASATSRIFDGRYSRWTAIVAALLPLIVALLNPARRVLWRTAAQAVACGLATLIAVRVHHGSWVGDTARSFTSGLGRIVAVRWPAPAEPISVGAVVLATAVAAAIACELAWSRRYAAVLLLPPVLLMVLVALLSPKAGPVPLGVVVFVVVASAAVLRLAFLARTEQRHQQLPTTERGANALVASVIGLVAVLPVAVGAPFGATNRFDLREARNQTSKIDEEISPLSRLDEWLSLSPPETFFTVKPADKNTRWRLVALTRYDGRAWMPSADFRPIGERLGTPRPGQRSTKYQVTIGSFLESWAPFVGDPISSSLRPSIDSTSSGIRQDQRFGENDVYDIEVVEPAISVDQLQATTADVKVARRLPALGSDILAGDNEIASLAQSMVKGAKTDYERATRIADALKTNYKLNNEAPAGHSLPQLRLFLTTSNVGRSEQFIAAYALLARSINLPVRIAVGVELDGSADVSKAMSDKVVAWPEVAFTGLGWQTFNPVPDNSVDVPAQNASPAAAASAGKAAPPPTTAPSPQVSPPSSTPDAAVAGDHPLSVAARFVLVGLLLVLAVLAYVATVVNMKRNRRQRRVHAQRVDERVAGAFLSSVDLAIDLGASTGPTLTNHELALSSTPVIGAASESLQTLAALATRAVYAGEEPGAEIAELAWEQASRVSEQTARSAGRLRWARAQISLKSLRQAPLDEPTPESSPPKPRRSVS